MYDAYFDLYFNSFFDFKFEAKPFFFCFEFLGVNLTLFNVFCLQVPPNADPGCLILESVLFKIYII